MNVPTVPCGDTESCLPPSENVFFSGLENISINERLNIQYYQPRLWDQGFVSKDFQSELQFFGYPNKS